MNNFKTYFTEESIPLEQLKDTVTAEPFNFTWILKNKTAMMDFCETVATRPIECDNIESDIDIFIVQAKYKAYDYVILPIPFFNWLKWRDLSDIENNKIFTYGSTATMINPGWERYLIPKWKLYNFYNSLTGSKQVKTIKLISYMKPLLEKEVKWHPGMDKILLDLKLKYLDNKDISPYDWGNAL